MRGEGGTGTGDSFYGNMIAFKKSKALELEMKLDVGAVADKKVQMLTEGVAEMIDSMLILISQKRFVRQTGRSRSR
jgi:hypothetical protein